MARVAIVGTGFIGRAWAISFARGGYDVALWDADPAAPEVARQYIAGLLPDLIESDLLNGKSASDIMSRLIPVSRLEDALAGVIHIQENTPEQLDVKKEVFRMLDAAAPEDAVIASSTSALLPSHFTEGLAGSHRCIVVHPINPPYLIPAAEIVPSRWTSEDVVERTAELMRQIGQKPIVMKQELDGFVMNRLQGALLEEAFRLVADGYASMEDIDIGIRDGLALRWSFMGPFETIDLNAPAGIRDYVTRYQQIYLNISPSMMRRVDWAGPVLEELEADRRKKLAETDLTARQEWRDRRLMALLAHKRQADREIGS